MEYHQSNSNTIQNITVANHNFRNYNYKSYIKNPFKPSYINTIDRIITKIERSFAYNDEELAQNLKECGNDLFHDFEVIRCIQFNKSEFINMEQDVIIAIFEENDQINMKYDNFEFQNAIFIQDLQGFNEWNRSIYGRHGNIHKDWRFQQRKDDLGFTS